MKSPPLPKPLAVSQQQWPAGTKPLVSIWCATYLHEAYVEKAVESFLMQETTFPVQIILHDDASEDRTPEIIRRYAEYHPQTILSVCQTSNIFKIGGVRALFTAFATQTRGKFIAACEGDDYWTTPHKLQQQVELLESNPDVTLCYHSHIEVDDIGKSLPSRPPRQEPAFFEQGDFIKGTFGDLTTASVVYRRSLIDNLPDWYLDLPFGDISLFAWASLKGRIGVIPGVHSAYRRHNGGMASHSLLTHDHDLHFKRKLFWHLHICRLYEHLSDEANTPELKKICRHRSYHEHMEAAWIARISNQRSAFTEHLKGAALSDLLAAISSSAFWKQLVFSVFPRLDRRRARYLADYCAGREIKLNSSK